MTKKANFEGENIVPIWQYKNMAKHDIETEVLNYWRELCAGRPMPQRSEIDPRGLENALEFAFVAERTKTGLVRLRVAGSMLNKSMNMDTRGMPISSFFDPLCRHRIKTELNKVFTIPAILRVSVTSLGQDAPMARGHWMILPLKGQEGRVDRAMGTYITTGATLAPFRPLIDAVELSPIAIPDGYFTVAEVPPNSEMAEAETPFLHKPSPQAKTVNAPDDHAPPARGKPDLRIVHSKP